MANDQKQWGKLPIVVDPVYFQKPPYISVLTIVMIIPLSITIMIFQKPFWSPKNH